MQVECVDGGSDIGVPAIAASEDVEEVVDDGAADVVSSCGYVREARPGAGLRVEDGDCVDAILRTIYCCN